mgnify:CR=1 FL=1
MTVLVTGAGGQLGREIVRQFSIEGHVVALARADLDVTIRADVHQAIRSREDLHKRTEVGAALDHSEVQLANLSFLSELADHADRGGSLVLFQLQLARLQPQPAAPRRACRFVHGVA